MGAALLPVTSRGPAGAQGGRQQGSSPYLEEVLQGSCWEPFSLVLRSRRARLQRPCCEYVMLRWPRQPRLAEVWADEGGRRGQAELGSARCCPDPHICDPLHPDGALCFAKRFTSIPMTAVDKTGCRAQIFFFFLVFTSQERGLQ